MDSDLYKIEYENDIIRANDFLKGFFDICEAESVIASVKLQLWNKSKCSWKQGKTFLRGKEKSFFGHNDVLHSENQLTDFKLTQGKRNYVFKVKIPPNISPSWRGAYGSIRCMVKIVVDYVNNIKRIFESDITVLPYRDLKLERHLLHESREDVSRILNVSLVNREWAELSVWFPVCGIAAGQSLPLLCTVKNKSAIVFNSLLLILNQNEIYRSTKPMGATKTKTFESVVLKRNADLLYGCYEYYCIMDIEKKMFPTSLMSANSCCSVNYNIVVKLIANPSESHDKIVVETPEMPIIIGTVPLLEWNIKDLTEELTKESLNLKPYNYAESDITESEIVSIDGLIPNSPRIL